MSRNNVSGVEMGSTQVMVVSLATRRHASHAHLRLAQIQAEIEKVHQESSGT